MDPSSAMCSGFLLEIWNGPQISGLGEVLVGKWESDVIGPSERGLVGRQLKVCRSVHLMGPGWGYL